MVLYNVYYTSVYCLTDDVSLPAVSVVLLAFRLSVRLVLCKTSF